MRERVPPGQRVVDKLPVLHYSDIPHIDIKEWRLKIYGLVSKELSLTYEELLKLPQKEFRCDVHCVTGWSKLDTFWEGFEVSEIIKLSKPLENAHFVMVHSADGYATNLSLEDFSKGFFAMKMSGKPLPPEHGYPLRLVVPHLYFWKSAKWVTAVEFIAEEKPGFWESRGYHIRGDPWKEERYSEI
ncbi:oxidoreductase molybdopterin binding protein [Ferroglobus placidus DSM 10642]|uniref:Oxidoreductase molybdopterin binding protein n=1 Tax=Ferroglobus placidus (strain DSM 10642 / AEDII12DO) TaxID=589924 RepID=D3RXP6_FERPA|nr:sulfite oxidase-like oxidoreductase [Ferroglobus placidus]ADC65259.1 oxidoreductase molybdopterin binding protein [Ferroglobus placidus DSM 10642]